MSHTIVTVRSFLLFVLLAALAFAQSTEGSYKIRFEPTAKLQTEAEIPFTIKVMDSRLQPMSEAKVLLICRLTDDPAEDFQSEARMVTSGTYIAKPTFPKAGTWDVRVEVTWNNKMSSRTMQFNIAD
jgi:hypothetical protein